MGQLIRKEAARQGEIFYTPIKPCVRCGTSTRYTKTGQCVSCHAAWLKNYSAANKHKINERNRSRWPTNQNRKNRQKAWQQTNRDKCRKACQVWARNNPAKTTALVGLRRALKRKACPAWVDKDQIKNVYEKARTLTKQTGTTYHVDHIVPLKHELVCGLHVPWNLQIIPAAENIAKANHLK